jgi:hypothetical protein
VAYEALAVQNEKLGRENTYCKQQLLPEYDHLLCRQIKQIQETQKELRDSEAKNMVLERERREVEEEHRSTLDTLNDRLKTQGQKIGELLSKSKKLLTRSRAKALTARKRQSFNRRCQELKVQEYRDLVKKLRRGRRIKLGSGLVYLV